MENKAGRYLQYAIGEVILVMVGILLALQVNNWNEKRLESETVSLFLQNLKQDLEADTAYFEYSIGNHVGRLYSLQNLLELSCNTKLAIEDTMPVLPASRSVIPILSKNEHEDIAETFRQASRPYYPHVNSNTYEEIKSTGYFSKISNQNLKSHENCKQNR